MMRLTNIPRFRTCPPIDVEALLVSVSIGDEILERGVPDWSAMHWVTVACATSRYSGHHFGAPCGPRCGPRCYS